MRYGYAASPEAEDLQDQVEILEDAQIPIDRQYAEIINHGHLNRKQLADLTARMRPGDEIVIRDFGVLGIGLLDAYDCVKDFEQKNISICIENLPPDVSPVQLLSTFEYLGEIFSRQKKMEPSGGKPRKAYPLGWRDAYRQYIAKEASASETFTALGLREYDFYRMVRRYGARKDGTK